MELKKKFIPLRIENKTVKEKNLNLLNYFSICEDDTCFQKEKKTMKGNRIHLSLVKLCV